MNEHAIPNFRAEWQPILDHVREADLPAVLVDGGQAGYWIEISIPETPGIIVVTQVENTLSRPADLDRWVVGHYPDERARDEARYSTLLEANSATPDALITTVHAILERAAP